MKLSEGLRDTNISSQSVIGFDMLVERTELLPRMTSLMPQATMLKSIKSAGSLRVNKRRWEQDSDLSAKETDIESRPPFMPC